MPILATLQICQSVLTVYNKELYGDIELASFFFISKAYLCHIGVMYF